MNAQTTNKLKMRSFVGAAAAVGLLLTFFTIQNFGQKDPLNAERATSRDGLIVTGYMTSAELSDDIEGTDDEYFYKFKAGPGKLTVTLEVTANETNAGAMLDLFSGSKPILSNMLVQAADRSSEMAFQSVTLSKAQDIVMRIKGMKYGSSARYPGVYKILLDGPAVKFTAAPVEGQGGEEEAPILPATGGKIPQNNQPDAPPSDAAGQGNNKPAEAPSTGTSPTKKPDAVDKAVEKGKSKANKVLDVLNKIKTKIPD